MPTKRFSIAVLLLILAYGGSAKGSDNTNINASSLTSLKPEVVVKTKTEILLRHRAAVKAAIEVLEQVRGGKQPEAGIFSSNDPRIVAIQILSELRAPEAVNELLRIVHVKTEPSIVLECRHPTTTGDYYPAAGALVKIGKPAVRPAVWQLTQEGSAQRRENLCWIIGEIEGPKAGRWRIEETIAEVESQIKKAEAKGLHPSTFQAQIKQIEKLQSAISILQEIFATQQQ